MTKVLLTSVAAIAVVLAFSGSAQARHRGHDYTPHAMTTAQAHDTWVYSSLCKAAIPVPMGAREAEVVGPYTPMKNMPKYAEPEKAQPIMIYGERNYDYSP